MTAPIISPLPAPPSRSQSPATFSQDADTFLVALPAFQGEANAQAAYLDALGVDVADDATASAASASAASTSASNAANSSSSAGTSATNAANSATAASGSATNAATSATSASGSQSAAANSATSSASSASTATSKATEASNSAANAASSDSNAAASASGASTSAANAASSASNASASAANAANSATAASDSASAAAGSQGAAASSASQAAASFDEFDDRYLGSKTSDPTLDNDGNALITGALYFNSVSNQIRVYDGNAWIASFLPEGDYVVGPASAVDNALAAFDGASGKIIKQVTNPILGAASATSIANGLGAVGTPSYTFTGDLNTGMFSPAADTVALSTAGAERLRIDSAGSVGINTASPTGGIPLTVEANAANAIAQNVRGRSDGIGVLLFSDNSNVENGRLDFRTNFAAISQARNAPLTFNTNNTERMRIDSLGRVGIGTSSPQRRLQVSVNAAPGAAQSAKTGLLIQNLDGSGTGGSPSTAVIQFAFDPASPRAYIEAGTFGNDLLAFGLGGTERMRIDSAGSVGIGTISPNGLLHLASASPAFFLDETDQATDEKKWRWNVASKVLFLQTTNDAVSAAVNAYQIVRGTGTAIDRHAFFTGASSERMRIDSAGRVGIGTISPGEKLTVVGGYADLGGLRIAGSAVDALNNIFLAAGELSLSTASGAVVFKPNLVERMRIDSSGNLLVATTTASSSSTAFGFVVTGTGSVVSRQQSGSANNHFTFVNGGTTVGSIVTSTTTTSYNISSDARLKHDIVDAPEASNFIDAIKVRSFKWNADNSEQRYGMIAQELLEVAPEAVSVFEDEDQMMGVDYSKLVPMMLKEMQSMRARLAQLETSAATITFEGN